MSKAKFFESCEISFGEIFKNNIYVIPKYQRAFSWEEKHIEELISDLKEAFLYEDENYYFLGTIYESAIEVNSETDKWCDEAIYNEIKNNKEKLYYLIDGQQRITSLLLLLSLLEKKYFYVDEEQKTQRLYIHEKDNSFFKSFFDQNAYSNIIDGESISQQRLKKAFMAMKKKQEELSEQKTFKEFLFEKIIFNKVTLTKRKFAVKLFETQNDRGKKLTYLEKLKSLFMLYDDRYNNNRLLNTIYARFGKLYDV
ncbi:MAG: DUF262 domain-containing protein, partial [Spirochaetota bacterium]|nr:DUF262 domain-containing protein [Spirochaetota bacterium]